MGKDNLWIAAKGEAALFAVGSTLGDVIDLRRRYLC